MKIIAILLIAVGVGGIIMGTMMFGDIGVALNDSWNGWYSFRNRFSNE